MIPMTMDCDDEKEIYVQCTNVIGQWQANIINN